MNEFKGNSINPLQKIVNALGKLIMDIIKSLQSVTGKIIVGVILIALFGIFFQAKRGASDKAVSIAKWVLGILVTAYIVWNIYPVITWMLGYLK